MAPLMPAGAPRVAVFTEMGSIMNATLIGSVMNLLGVGVSHLTPADQLTLFTSSPNISASSPYPDV